MHIPETPPLTDIHQLKCSYLIWKSDIRLVCQQSSREAFLGNRFFYRGLSIGADIHFRVSYEKLYIPVIYKYIKQNVSCTTEITEEGE